MGKRYDRITDPLWNFIEEQKLFFVATAAPDGHINLSPKGLDSLRVINPNRVLWLNLTGSGNETAAHLREDGRMTLMFCAFEGEPKILRLYGRARALHVTDAEWEDLIGHFPRFAGPRQIIDMQVELVQTSCGFGVPLFDYAGERGQLDAWAQKKGAEGIRQYWLEKNAVSLDGRPTGVPGEN